MFIDYVALKAALEEMKPQSKLYKVVKAELIARGHWKAKARGKAMQPGYDPRRKGGQ